MLKLEISDTGCGIDENDLPVVFDRYHTTKETGTGLGLAVVERIISAHGGRVEVSSEKNVGTTFGLYFPR
jgi:signal transduction histidine kinase